MKTLPVLAIFFLAITPIAFSQATDSAPKGEHPATPKTIVSYQDVLSCVPADLRATNARAWTRGQRETVNAALQKSLIDTNTPARLRLKVVDIADWGGVTFYADIPNQQGYYIRVFGKFTGDWNWKVTALKKGDTAFLEGILKSATYRDLWGKFTLSICLKDCTFKKLESPDQPNIRL
jgi:hypothetical protein